MNRDSQMRKDRPVVGAKIMAPFRNTMDFINSKKCYSATFCKPLKWFDQSAETCVKLIQSYKKGTTSSQRRPSDSEAKPYLIVTSFSPYDCLWANINNAIHSSQCLLFYFVVRLTRSKKASCYTMF